MGISNWMTRLLSQGLREELSMKHVEMAIKLLEDHCIVGLYNDMPTSINRVLDTFHWDESAPGGRLGTMNCLEEFYKTEFVNDLVVEGTEEWKLLVQINKYDMILYENILQIYEQQNARYIKTSNYK